MNKLDLEAIEKWESQFRQGISFREQMACLYALIKWSGRDSIITMIHNLDKNPDKLT